MAAPRQSQRPLPSWGGHSRGNPRADFDHKLVFLEWKGGELAFCTDLGHVSGVGQAWGCRAGMELAPTGELGLILKLWEPAGSRH